MAEYEPVLLAHVGREDSHRLRTYEAHGGYATLRTVLRQSTPADVVKLVQASGLRGRGGAGFPTAVKWQLTRRAAGPVKYVICNADEGDPGAFMDRLILESFPFRVIEGLSIAALAVGATEGYLYIRAEYPLATRRIRDALKICEA